MAGKGLRRISPTFLDPFAQDILMNVQIASRLRDADAALPYQLYRFKLVFAAELPSLHSHSPISEDHLISVSMKPAAGHYR